MSDSQQELHISMTIRPYYICFLDLVLLINSENAHSHPTFNSITNSLACHLYSSCTFSFFFSHSLTRHPFCGCSLLFLNYLNLKFFNVNMTVSLNAHHGIFQRICYSFNSYYISPFTCLNMTGFWMGKDDVFSYLPDWHSSEIILVWRYLFILASVNISQCFLIYLQLFFYKYINFSVFCHGLFINSDFSQHNETKYSNCLYTLYFILLNKSLILLIKIINPFR